MRDWGRGGGCGRQTSNSVRGEATGDEEDAVESSVAVALSWLPPPAPVSRTDRVNTATEPSSGNAHLRPSQLHPSRQGLLPSSSRLETAPEDQEQDGKVRRWRKRKRSHSMRCRLWFFRASSSEFALRRAICIPDGRRHAGGAAPDTLRCASAPFLPFRPRSSLIHYRNPATMSLCSQCYKQTVNAAPAVAAPRPAVADDAVPEASDSGRARTGRRARRQAEENVRRQEPWTRGDPRRATSTIFSARASVDDDKDA